MTTNETNLDGWEVVTGSGAPSRLWRMLDKHVAFDDLDFGLPHPANRPGQRETIEWLRDRPNGATVVADSPTGSGKTSFAAAVSYGEGRRAMALVKTKSLQVENYGQSYAFAVLKGRGNYLCANPDAMPGAMASDCLFGANMNDCPSADSCEYLIARRAARSSEKTSLNYSYWLTSKWPRIDLAEQAKSGRAYLVMDEAHQLSDITLDWTSATVSMKDRVTWDLPAFPVAHGHARPEDVAAATGWLDDAAAIVWRAVKPLVDKRSRYTEGIGDPLSDNEQKTLTAGERLYEKIGNTAEALLENSADWYIRSGPGAIFANGAPMPGFVARPLTARYHFPGLFLGDWASVLMSATIGDPATFAEELGLPANYLYRAIPNQFTPDQRPVFVLPAPAMGQKNRDDETALAEQARVIAEAINTCPRTWGGIIHVTRKSEAAALGDRLRRHGLGGRIWTPRPGDSTDWAMRDWQQFKRRVKGALAITWAWWEGYDGTEEKICIVAKTPFPNLADDYERARMAYSGTMFLQRTAWNLEQALGRTRRGRDEDYDTPGERRGLVAIADGNYTRAMKYASPSLQAALRPW